MGKWTYKFTLTGKELPVYTGYEPGWASEALKPVWMQ
jgi:hypothetical protein